jgi:hypothetical protein
MIRTQTAAHSPTARLETKNNVRSETSLDHNDSNPDCSSSTRSPSRNEKQKQVELKDEEKAAER